MNKPLVPEDLIRGHITERRALNRALAAMLLSASGRRRAADVLKSAWPADRLAADVLKAATSPMMTGNLPPTERVVTLPNLAPQSAALRLFSAGLSLDLSGATSIKIPRIDAPPPPAIFIAEGAPAPAVQVLIGAASVGPTKKILLLSAVSAELENAAPESAASIVGTVLSNSVSKGLDAVAFGTAAGTADQPAGLLSGVTPLAASTEGGALGMSADLGAMAQAMADAGIDPAGMVIAASPRQAVALKILVGPKFDSLVLGSLALPDGTVVAVAPSAVASAVDDSPSISTSKQSTVHFEDTTPLPIVDGTPASPVRSAYQTDVIVIRCRAKADWTLAAAGAVQMVEGVKW